MGIQELQPTVERRTGRNVRRWDESGVWSGAEILCESAEESALQMQELAKYIHDRP